MRQRRNRAWQAWLAIAGLVAHLLSMVAIETAAHAQDTIVDPATGQVLVMSLCTGDGVVDAPADDTGAPHVEHRHDCVLCATHGAALPATVAPPPAPPAPASPVWAPVSPRAPPGRAFVAGLPRGPPSLG